MGKADRTSAAAGQSSVALLIIGGGIMGLWAAVKAERQGIDTLLVDGGPLGQGASGGLLGALMAHTPDRWNDKKQFQFDALLSLEQEIADLEAETGSSVGYRRCGRLIPLAKPHQRAIAEAHGRDAAVHWRQGRAFVWTVTDAPTHDGWPAAGESGCGLVHDTFAARVSPRRLTAKMISLLRRARHVRLAEGAAVASINPVRGTARIEDGVEIAFGHCIIAAGHRSFRLMDTFGPPLGIPLGMAVKGQAALMRAGGLSDRPLIFRDGLYVVPHDGDTVAIGSTSENSFADPSGTDAQLDDLVTAARALVPALAQAPVIERWAGLRPKAIGRDPMIGPHPEHPHILALTGGFKVSFGVAHRLAGAVLAGLQGGPAAVPPSFLYASHLSLASRNT